MSKHLVNSCICDLPYHRHSQGTKLQNVRTGEHNTQEDLQDVPFFVCGEASAQEETLLAPANSESE